MPSVIAAVVLAVLGYAGVAGGRQYLADASFHPIVVPAAVAPAADAASVLAAATAAPSLGGAAPAQAPAPTASAVTAALGPALTVPALGPSVSAQVVDAATGTALLSERTQELVAPASTAKLLTAAALLQVHHATDRFTTRVVAGATPGTVVLVGGGDPTLSGAAAGQPSEYAEAARVSDLATQVRAALGSTPITHVLVDDSLFTGPATATGWAAADAPSSYASPITAAMVDAGRDVPDAANRSAAPDLAAGRALATALAGASVQAGVAPSGARVLASVQSAPVSTLIEQMLSDSDNVIAEVLGRQVALAVKAAPSFAGAAAAIAQTLSPLGIAVGNTMHDASGLSGLDRVRAVTLGQVLVMAAGSQRPDWRPILSGLSVAGWDGTLLEQDRFTGSAAVADGAVRAKTGSLDGVSGLAGVVTDADGRQLVFSFVADQVPDLDPTPARTALDAVVAVLARCGCR